LYDVRPRLLAGSIELSQPDGLRVFHRDVNYEALLTVMVRDQVESSIVPALIVKIETSLKAFTGYRSNDLCHEEAF